MNNGCRIESGGNANYQEIIPIHYFDPSILKLKMQHKNNTVFAADSTDCRALLEACQGLLSSFFTPVSRQNR